MGCSQQAEEEPLVVVSNTEDVISYKLSDVAYQDVYVKDNVSCTYVQTKEQEVSFETGGKIVEKVYVRAGDTVKRGDILLELEVGNIEEEIATLEYQIERNKLLLSYLDPAEEFEKSESYYTLVYNTKMEEDDVKDKDKRDESIADNYRYQREDYEDAIEFDTRKLEQKKAELAANRVYATMDGTVLSVAKDLEGSTAKRGTVIMTIVNGEDGLFSTESPEEVAGVKDSDMLPMHLAYGEGKGDYVLVPYNRSSWGEKQYFKILEAPETAGNIEVGSSGTMVVTKEFREHVLAVPSSTVYQAGDEYYVYMLDENNLRVVRTVEVGLIGDEYTEILSGLSENDQVVRR